MNNHTQMASAREDRERAADERVERREQREADARFRTFAIEPSNDLRSPLALARDKFMGDKGRTLADVHSLGAPGNMAQFLRNRIEAAFLAGVMAAKTIPRKDR